MCWEPLLRAAVTLDSTHSVSGESLGCGLAGGGLGGPGTGGSGGAGGGQWGQGGGGGGAWPGSVLLLGAATTGGGTLKLFTVQRELPAAAGAARVVLRTAARAPVVAPARAASDSAAAVGRCSRFLALIAPFSHVLALLAQLLGEGKPGPMP
ncbi:hypothetical protein HYH02_008620 [Chlamydomonas schloesseri]|uniref:Uncharacterized protein n=1 Tax=Chlamydomonas schloesseri TaxID=2026947 RepID=A0A835WD19_9CHLO|nr:hypothetical protein HYH02_008620 [Chlamydomonas schloesseri]|eukprot:KAG2445152.1 hypothetical protein HYH02_008620 [Chlamydomonas schloesseri]